jgi:hypothetical protein
MRGGRCSECGLLPDGHGRIVLIEDGVAGEGFPDNPEERCSHCGRRLWFALRVEYEDAGGNDAVF